MAKKKASEAAESGKDTPVLGSVASPDSGVPLHSFEASRGPINSGATDTREAFGIESPAPEEAKTKGKAYVVKSRPPAYTKYGRTFYQSGVTVRAGDFSDEDWSGIRTNPNLIVTAASESAGE